VTAAAAPSHARLDEQDSILTVTIDRQAKRNAISPEVTDMLWAAVHRVAVDPALRALVITAEGQFFTAGIDLKAPMPATVAATGSEFRALYRRHHALYDEMEALEKPVVLAAQGPCLGAGVEMACSADFRFASEVSSFQLPEVGLGMIAGSGGTSRLTRLVGVHWAKWMAMAARSVDAQQALQIGLVHEVFPLDGFHTLVHERVREIIGLPAEALGAAKAAIDLVADVAPAGGRQIERFVNSQLAFGGEFTELHKKWR
jgi:enoyl-CoA hydratase/carnithine racemase